MHERWVHAEAHETQIPARLFSNLFDIDERRAKRMSGVLIRPRKRGRARNAGGLPLVDECCESAGAFASPACLMHEFALAGPAPQDMGDAAKIRCEPDLRPNRRRSEQHTQR